MSTRQLILLAVAGALWGVPLFAQQKVGTSPCMVEYENHNQIDYGPLVVQDVKGTITDPGKSAVSKGCVGVFTETDHKLVAATESNADGKFSLQSVPPGRYRLVVKADPLCAANVPLRVVKNQRNKQVLHVHMKPRGLDSCSYADLGTESATSSGKSSPNSCVQNGDTTGTTLYDPLSHQTGISAQRVPAKDTLVHESGHVDPSRQQ